MVGDSNILLDDSEVDLAPFVGQVVGLRGQQLLSVLCPNPILAVSSIETATSILDVCGTAQAGCPLSFRVGPPTISVNQVWASLGDPTFFPLDDSLGTLLLTPPFILVGSHGPGQSFSATLPSLVGVPVTFQGYHLEVGPIVNAGSLSNPVRISIAPPGGPFCLDPSSCF